MKNCYQKMFFYLTILLAVSACAGIQKDSPVKNEQLPGELFRDTAGFITKSAPAGSIIAIYPIQSRGQIHELSEFLIEGMTAELSRDENFSIVNRAALEQILEEQALQLTGITAEETNVEIGKILGADILVRGYIEEKNLLIQLVDVESGRNLKGGQFQIADEYFAGINERKIVKTQYIIQEKGLYEIVIMEDFSDNVLNFEFTADSFEDGRVFYNSYRMLTPEKDKMIFSFGAQIGDLTSEDGYAGFVLNIKRNQFPREAEGIFLRLTPENFRIIEYGTADFSFPGTLNAGQSSEIIIPFSFFKGYDSETITLTVYPGYNLSFMGENSFDGSLNIEEVGYYLKKNKSAGGMMPVSFEDELMGAFVSAQIYGYPDYVDYRKSDEGTRNVNTGIDFFDYQISYIASGAVGRGLNVEFFLGGLNGDINKFFQAEQDLSVSVALHFSSLDADQDYFLLFLKSDILRTGSGDIYFSNGEFAGYTDFGIGPVWMPVKMQLESPVKAGVYQMVLNFTVPRNLVLKAAAGTGELSFTLGIDEIMNQ